MLLSRYSTVSNVGITVKMCVQEYILLFHKTVTEKKAFGDKLPLSF